MVKQDLDVTDPFTMNEKTSLPRDYYTYAACGRRDKRCRRRLGSSSSSDDE